MVMEGAKELVWGWLVPVLLLFVFSFFAIGWLVGNRRKRKMAETDIWVANTSYLNQLPQLKSWIRKYRFNQLVGALALVVILLGSATLASRPVTIEVSNKKLATRDIVLCLDISISMIEWDRQVVEVFETLVQNFEGERIALSVFNSTSRVVFPLTDDYDLVQGELKKAHKALNPRLAGMFYSQQIEDDYLELAEGTMAYAGGSSLVGDGLVNCAMMFDHTDSERSRSIILATDNEVHGIPAYTVPEAVAEVEKRNASLTSLYADTGAPDAKDLEAELRNAVESMDGMHFYSDDASAVDSIVASVQSQQAIDLDATPEVTRVPRVGGWYWWLVAGLSLLLLVQTRLKE